jgi:hypothetical protein
MFVKFAGLFTGLFRGGPLSNVSVYGVEGPKSELVAPTANVVKVTALACTQNMQADESTSKAKDLRINQSPFQNPNKFLTSRCFNIATITSTQVRHHKISDLCFRSNMGPTDRVRISGRPLERLDIFLLRALRKNVGRPVEN